MKTVTINIYKIQNKEKIKICSCVCRKTSIPNEEMELLGAIERDVTQYDVRSIVPAPEGESNLTNNKDMLYNIIRSNNNIVVEEDNKQMNILQQSIFKDNTLFWFKTRENTKKF